VNVCGFTVLVFLCVVRLFLCVVRLKRNEDNSVSRDQEKER
jgi:hypothetical protein